MRTPRSIHLLLALALGIGTTASAQTDPNGLPIELQQLLTVAAERSLARSEKAKKVLTNDLSIAGMSLLKGVLARRHNTKAPTSQESEPSPGSPLPPSEGDAPSQEDEVDVQSPPNERGEAPPSDASTDLAERSTEAQANPLPTGAVAQRPFPSRTRENRRLGPSDAQSTIEAKPSSGFLRAARPTRVPEQASTVRDERLVGRWQRMEYKAGTVVSVTKYYNAVLHRDGRGTFSETSETGYGGTLRGGSQSDSTLPGRWKTSGSLLTVQLADEEAENYHYELRSNGTGGVVLRLRPSSGGALQEWSLIQ